MNVRYIVFFLSLFCFTNSFGHYGYYRDSNDSISYSEGILLFEDFTNHITLPPGWEIIGGGNENWAIENSKSSGAEIPEVVFSASPSFNGVSRLVSPPVNTSSLDSLLLQFSYFVHKYDGGSTIMVETTSDGETWNPVWTMDITNTINATKLFVPISNEDVGSENFQISFTHSGSSYGVFSWNIDDIKLSEIFSFDAEASKIIIPTVMGENEDIHPKVTVSNQGAEIISFFSTLEIYDDNSNTIYSSQQLVENLSAYTSHDLIYPSWETVAGNYTFSLFVTLSNDEDISNNEVSSTMEVPDNIIFLKPLYEEFTSSTCGPCALQNPYLDAVLAANPYTHSLIKYQVNWPGFGDPYYIPDVTTRVNYYDINAAPKLLINNNVQWVGGMTQDVYDTYQNVLTNMDIDVSATIDFTMNLSVNAQLNVIEEYEPGLTAHIAIVEKTTEGNASTNGEVEFFNVLLKMLPDGGGTTLSALMPETPCLLSESFDMNQTYMEDLTDLAVVVFVQNEEDKSIIQSEMVDVFMITGTEDVHNTYTDVVTVYPNPANSMVFIHSYHSVKKIEVFNVFGQSVYRETGSVSGFNVSGWDKGTYVIKLFADKLLHTEKIIIQ